MDTYKCMCTYTRVNLQIFKLEIRENSTLQMPKTLIKLRLHSNKYEPKMKQKLNKTKPSLPPILQVFKQKLLSRSGFVENN